MLYIVNYSLNKVEVDEVEIISAGICRFLSFLSFLSFPDPIVFTQEFLLHRQGRTAVESTSLNLSFIFFFQLSP